MTTKEKLHRLVDALPEPVVDDDPGPVLLLRLQQVLDPLAIDLVVDVESDAGGVGMSREKGSGVDSR